eukprot:10158346-Alexandrium_andersonii.AAC.1
MPTKPRARVPRLWHGDMRAAVEAAGPLGLCTCTEGLVKHALGHLRLDDPGGLSLSSTDHAWGPWSTFRCAPAERPTRMSACVCPGEAVGQAR